MVNIIPSWYNIIQYYQVYHGVTPMLSPIYHHQIEFVYSIFLSPQISQNNQFINDILKIRRVLCYLCTPILAHNKSSTASSMSVGCQMLDDKVRDIIMTRWKGTVPPPLLVDPSSNIFLQDFLKFLKRMLQKIEKILKKCSNVCHSVECSITTYEVIRRDRNSYYLQECL